MTTGAEVRILGPVEVAGPKGDAVLVGARHRALIGLLALNPGTVVSRPKLLEGLWGEEPPRTAIKTLHSYVARVRQALAACGLPDVLITQMPGYVLLVEPSSVDAHRFLDQARTGRHRLGLGDPGAAAAHLRTALGLWRGDALADAEPAGWVNADIDRLNEARQCALEDLADARLELGEHEGMLDELLGLVARHPLRERPVELLMLGLHRSGRSADALLAYQRLRERLAEELGCDPGPALQRLHAAILRGPAGSPAAPTAPRPAAADQAAPHPGPPRPAQLPPRVGHFTGREEELRGLDRLLDADQADTRVAVVSGAAGIGKTSLVVQWAQSVRSSFPDGQCYVDLRGHDPATALRPEEALARVLRSLNVAADRIPADVAEQAALCRSLLDGKRLLILLDDAGSAEQVLPLVPAAPGVLLLVTARDPLPALTTYHAVHAVRLGTLSQVAALELLGRVLGPERVAAEQSEAARTAQLCGWMPLALRIAAARLVVDSTATIAGLAAELSTGDRLDALAVDGGSRSVRAAFASAYRTLSPPAARLFRLLGLHPGSSFGVHLAAAAADLSIAEARSALADLARAQLVIEVSGDRYRFHDLIRLYARERAAAADSTGERAEVEDRILDWYLALAVAASRTFKRTREDVVPEIRYPPVELPFPAEIQPTVDYLDGERDNLVSVVEYAAGHGHAKTAWQLTYLLIGFYDLRGHWRERIRICQAGVAAAAQLGDPAAEGLMRSGLGVAYIMTAQYQPALVSLHRALPLMQAAQDARGEGHVHNNIAVAYAEQRCFDEAVAAFGRALAIHTASGQAIGIALAEANIGEAYVRMGQPQRSAPHLQRSLAVSREITNPWLEARALLHLGQADVALGDADSALGHLREALRLQTEVGDRRHAAETLIEEGRAQLLCGEDAAALSALERALALSREIDDPRLEALSVNELASAYRQAGNPAAARDYVRQTRTLLARAPDQYQQATLHRTLAELAEDAGDPAGAQRNRDEAARLYRAANARFEADELAARSSSRRRSVGDPDHRGPADAGAASVGDEPEAEALRRLAEAVTEDGQLEDHPRRAGRHDDPAGAD